MVLALDLETRVLRCNWSWPWKPWCSPGWLWIPASCLGHLAEILLLYMEKWWSDQSNSNAGQHLAAVSHGHRQRERLPATPSNMRSYKHYHCCAGLGDWGPWGPWPLALGSETLGPKDLTVPWNSSVYQLLWFLMAFYFLLFFFSFCQFYKIL